MPTVAGLPGTPYWIKAPVSHEGDPTGELTITAGPRCDWFRDPSSGGVEDGAPALLGPVTGDFSLSAVVRVRFAGTFDAGALAVRIDATRWAKLCFELSPQGQPMVVSVVTRERSDDANSFAVTDDRVWLRVARTGRSFAFHASTDGQWWHFVRHFTLGVEGAPTPGTVAVGVVVQSPMGDGCTATFSELTFSALGLTDLRDGS